MIGKGLSLPGWFCALSLCLAAFVYVDNTGSQYTATNPDEYHYLQVARLTAETGHWLPLQGANVKARNTKPPALFWQGIACTNWGKQWELWRLRLPNALYSIATATLVFLLASKMGGGSAQGTIAALSYLAFLGVYRHGRVFLTSAPETFWLFLPFFILLIRPESWRPNWRTSALFGLLIGIGLLWKSFAMVIPAVAAIAWWTWKVRGYETRTWLREDGPKLALTGIIALAVFALWFALDPQRHLIFGDFILKENVGKFETGQGSYFINALAGKHSIWVFALGWLTNAGLVAPAVLAVFVISWCNRQRLSREEQLLWIWIITLFVFHLLPNLRYERYLLPAMPAVAVLCGLYWERIPRWVAGTMLVACGSIGIALLAGAVLLSRQLPGSTLYTALDWIALAAIPVLCVACVVQKQWTRASALPAVLLVYLGFTFFLRPFDGPMGAFPAAAIDTARGRAVIVPSPFGARDELYRFLLPGAEVHAIKEKNLAAAIASNDNELFVFQSSLSSNNAVPGFHTVGKRLVLRDYFKPDEIADMLRGNIAAHLFAWDLLAERN